MGYDSAKIYKLICNDGHYYYGSTITELRRRLWNHKKSSETMTSKVYNHINSIGWNNVKIELVELYSCNNREELRIKENLFILESKDDKLCLNTLNAHTPIEEKKRMEKERQTKNKIHRSEVVHAYYEKNKDTIRKNAKNNYILNKNEHQKKCKQYNETNKDSIAKQRKQYYNENKDKLCEEKKKIRKTEEYKQYMRDYRNKNKERINQLKRDKYVKNKAINE
jgi:hypothetical protein